MKVTHEGIRLDIGCGRNKRPGFIGIDKEDYSDLYNEGEFICRDIEKGLPFCDNSVDEIFCQHVLEHIFDLDFVIHEIWRVLKPGRTVTIIVPHRDSPNAYKDPTHIRFFTEHSFEYYTDERIEKTKSTKARFKKVFVEVNANMDIVFVLEKV